MEGVCTAWGTMGKRRNNLVRTQGRGSAWGMMGSLILRPFVDVVRPGYEGREGWSG